MNTRRERTVAAVVDVRRLRRFRFGFAGRFLPPFLFDRLVVLVGVIEAVLTRIVERERKLMFFLLRNSRWIRRSTALLLVRGVIGIEIGRERKTSVGETRIVVPMVRREFVKRLRSNFSGDRTSVVIFQSTKSRWQFVVRPRDQRNELKRSEGRWWWGWNDRIRHQRWRLSEVNRSVAVKRNGRIDEVRNERRS